MSLRSAVDAFMSAWNEWYDSVAVCPSHDLTESVAELQRTAEEEDSCSYDEQEDDRELTLGNFLWAQMAAERHSHEGWRTREICAERGELMGPGDLEHQIARVDAPPETRWLQYHSLAIRYRHLLEQVIDTYGGTERVWQHLRHLQECRRHGTPPGPLPPTVDMEQLQQAAARAMWRALTMGLA